MKIFLSGLLMWFLYAGLAFAQNDPNRPWATWGDAGLGYWLIASLIMVSLFAFVAWSLWLRGKDPEEPSTTRYHALGSLVVVMTFFTLALYLIVATEAQSVPATDRAWDWQPGEMLQDPGGANIAGEPYRGYHVYLANGCTYCHTLYLRPEDVVTGWGEGAQEADVSQMGDFVNYPFGLLGTQRSGPDLTIIGKRIPDMTYQIEHLKDPGKFKPNTVMPNFDYLSDQDLADLAAYLVSLGNNPVDLKAGTLTQQPPDENASEAVQLGQSLYRGLGCVGCHTIDGNASLGPTWKDLWGKQETLDDGAVITVDEAYLIEAIVDPGASIVQGFPNVMQPYDLSDEELNGLVEYIKSLGGS